MILVHKLKGDEIWVNPDLVAFIESGHDTLLRLIDGRHVVLADSPAVVVAAIAEYRASVLARAFRIADESERAPLKLVADPEEV